VIFDDFNSAVNTPYFTTCILVFGR